MKGFYLKVSKKETLGQRKIYLFIIEHENLQKRQGHIEMTEAKNNYKSYSLELE